MYCLEVPKNVITYDFLKLNIKSIFKIPLNNFINTTYIKDLNDYLLKTYQVDLKTITNIILKNLYVGEDKTKSIIFIEDNVNVNNYKLKQILSLIEYGNREIKGIQLLSKIFDYLKRNLYYIHIYYTLKENH